MLIHIVIILNIDESVKLVYFIILHQPNQIYLFLGVQQTEAVGS